ncbi:hypothetical protein O181_007244 [Austropuccinia psidii MF-1]|uniref:Uncharacterized protein n=1 Tax=Austropuccinia psidii MF-1 TaxID=1389203 RepID=A0A9Q3GHP4_9BASI|nr:hypothetical protein [Austropuccinia psidii MF-1]
MSCFLKQKYILASLHPEVSETMIHKRILKKCGGDLENAIRRRCIETFSTEYYINSMEDITNRNKIGRNYYEPPIDNKTCGKPISTKRPTKTQDRAPFKSHNFSSNFNLADSCIKKARINEIQLEKNQDTKETNKATEHESDSEPSEEDRLPY